MKTEILNMRVSRQEKSWLVAQAEKCRENLSQFIINSVLYRMSEGKVTMEKPEDPFLAAVRRLTAAQDPEAVPADLKEEIFRDRKLWKQGKLKTMSPSEAAGKLKSHFGVKRGGR